MEALDTDVLIILEKALAEEEHPEYAKAQALLQEMDQGRIFILPLPVLSEFLTGLDEERWQETVDYIQRHFRLLELNRSAAIEAALLFKKKLLKDAPKGQERQCIRTDVFILGIALANGCQRIYTLDRRMKALMAEEERIEIIEGLPEPKQPPLLQNF